MEIGPTSPLDPLAASSVGMSGSGLTEATTDTMGRDEFLKLLMAQLEHQDPMNPMENHEFVAQLATFSGLEQQILANQRLQELQLAQMSASNAQLAGFIGKQITAGGEQISLDGKKAAPIGIQLDAPADKVTITVRDAAGKIVYSGERTALSAGQHEITWPGTGANGNPLEAGVYDVEVSASDANGNPVGAAAVVTGIVTGVTFENGYPELLVGDLRVQPAQILSIGAGDGSAPPPPLQPQSDPPKPALGLGG
jgi:flagellar basal-body rod modification protein FlgD